MSYLVGCWFCRWGGRSGQPNPPDGPVCDACHRRLERFRAWILRGAL